MDIRCDESMRRSKERCYTPFHTRWRCTGECKACICGLRKTQTGDWEHVTTSGNGGVMNSKQKGKRGELECANMLRDLGFENVRRTAQYNGKETGSLADLIGIDGVHIEVKRNEHLNVNEAMSQAVRDCKEGEVPMVFHRKNGTPWLVTMNIEDWARREHVYQKELEHETREL